MTILYTLTPALLTSEQACDYLGVSRNQLQGLESANHLVPIDVAGTKKFRRVDLDAFIAACPDWAGVGGHNAGRSR